MNIRYLFVFLCCLAGADELTPQVVENLNSDAILETRQIKIPGYPSAFNPSMIAYKDGYLLLFRARSHLPKSMVQYRIDASFLGVARLNKQFKVDPKSVQLLNISSYDSKFSFHAEDGRLFQVGEQIFILFNDLHPSMNRDGFFMYIGELIEEKSGFVLKGSALPLNYPKAISIEKNWTPFVFENRVYLIYSDKPRVILYLDLQTGECREVVRADNEELWKFGQVRGGTPATLVDGQYLTFFHSRFYEEAHLNFVVGAYLFEPQFPFAVQKVTEVPLGKPSDYLKDNSKKVVYPCGMVVQGDLIYISWGKNDQAIYLTVFDKRKLFALMKSMKI